MIQTQVASNEITRSRKVDREAVKETPGVALKINSWYDILPQDLFQT